MRDIFYFKRLILRREKTIKISTQVNPGDGFSKHTKYYNPNHKD